ncbi:MAG TPA: hypothetical protein PK034_06800 [Rugosibacter sp.]|nr:hypothetical protein [Rugosibacter sp.]
MQSFDIVKKCDPSDSFRVQSLIGKFDLKKEMSNERFVGQIPSLDDSWKIGVIYGHSGTGKSTIAKEIYGISDSHDYGTKSIVDEMPDNKTVQEISMAFSSVGFSSPPSWLKPFGILSNGEKMRVEIARHILDNESLIVFDEFTSVVDRNVAKISSFAIQKAVRRSDKRFVAVSCHDDIIDWLEPDWVFSTNTMTTEWYKKKDQTSSSIFIENHGEHGNYLGSIII